MNAFKSAKSGQYAGIVYIALAVLSLLGMLLSPYTRSLWTFLEVVAYAYTAAMLLIKRRDALMAIGFGVLLLLSLRSLFVVYGFINIITVLLQVLAYGSMTLFALADFIPSLKDPAGKYWFIPAGCMAVCIVPLFLTGVFNWIFNGLPFFGYFVLMVLSGIIGYLISAAGLYFAAAWTQSGEGAPAGGPSRPQYQPYQGAAGQGPRAASAGAPYAAPAGAYAAGDAAQGGVMPASAYCSLVKHILLLLFTFGIWYFIWIYRTTENLNCLQDEEPRNPGTKLLLCMFVPFYSIYWVYKSAQRIDRLSAMAGRPADSATLCLVLAIFVAIVPPILMQDKINNLALPQGAAPQGAPYAAQPSQGYAAPQRQAQPQPRVQQQPQAAYQAPQQPRPQAGVVDAAEELKKFKELLDMGAITQEEYDAKKKQLLGL